MSTPERQQDPGEYGYGGTDQDAPNANDDGPDADDPPQDAKEVREGSSEEACRESSA